jgi:dTDP-4-dehydrorhamnose 3,5-epimerase
MDVTRTRIPGVMLIKPRVFGDARGHFCETHNRRIFTEHGLDIDFVQDNQAFSVQPGVLRGLHFQTPPMAQTKLVRVARGSVFDVVADLRTDSPTFGRWEGFTLSSENCLQLLIPKGLAHGYMTTESNTLFLYKVDQFYSPEHDGGIRWDDPGLGIVWPDLPPLLSNKDTALPRLENFDSPFLMEQLP